VQQGFFLRAVHSPSLLCGAFARIPNCMCKGASALIPLGLLSLLPLLRFSCTRNNLGTWALGAAYSVASGQGYHAAYGPNTDVGGPG
jgi:hypothetical protein